MVTVLPPARTGPQTSLGGILSAGQGSFEILGRDQIGDENSQVFKRVRVVTTVNYRLR